MFTSTFRGTSITSQSRLAFDSSVSPLPFQLRVTLLEPFPYPNRHFNLHLFPFLGQDTEPKAESPHHRPRKWEAQISRSPSTTGL